MSIEKLKNDVLKKTGESLSLNSKGVKKSTDSELAKRGSERGEDVVIVVD